jgi:hypothetical protein|tara:strand:- start:8778 stop:9002 length:225 start_codon:yes stop_codon:yes gene_type:complete
MEGRAARARGRQLPTAARVWWTWPLAPRALPFQVRARHATVRTNFLMGRRVRARAWLADPGARVGTVWRAGGAE